MDGFLHIPGPQTLGVKECLLIAWKVWGTTRGVHEAHWPVGCQVFMILGLPIMFLTGIQVPFEKVLGLPIMFLFQVPGQIKANDLCSNRMACFRSCESRCRSFSLFFWNIGRASPHLCRCRASRSSMHSFVSTWIGNPKKFHATRLGYVANPLSHSRLHSRCGSRGRTSFAQTC